MEPRRYGPFPYTLINRRPKLEWPNGTQDERANIVWIQDYAVQVGLGPIKNRTNEWLGRSDTALILQRKIWERELRALAENEPLKQWIRTERLAAIRTSAND